MGIFSLYQEERERENELILDHTLGVDANYASVSWNRYLSSYWTTHCSVIFCEVCALEAQVSTVVMIPHGGDADKGTCRLLTRLLCYF